MSYLDSLVFLWGFIFHGVSAWEYCIIGAGPGGLQVAYYLHKMSLNYVVLERGEVPGSFFQKFPRRRTLISINKRNTGETNTEFNMRHDWNSLLSDDPNMVFGPYSKDLFPPADALVKYLGDFSNRFNLNIHYEKHVVEVIQSYNQTYFTLFVNDEELYICDRVIASTGIPVLTDVVSEGAKFITPYDKAPHDPEFYENKKVLILGKGNSGFETADLIYGRTAYVHMISRSQIKLSWATHYVGDLRGINNNLLDTYQLKSLDAVIECEINEEMLIRKTDGQYYLYYHDESRPAFGPYDIIINCMGFNYDGVPFRNLTGEGRRGQKYPDMDWDFQSKHVPNLFYAGTITHGLDKRVSSGGFIHGFRYSARSLTRILGALNHNIRWPRTEIPLRSIVSGMLRRLNEMNGPYQMFYILTDVYVKEGDVVHLYTDIPHGMLHRIHELIMKEDKTSALDMLVVRLEYGEGFSKVGSDPFRASRVQLDPFLAHTCNFIHPVVYRYTRTPPVVPLKQTKIYGFTEKIHLSEDLHTDFATLNNHLYVLKNFLGSVWNVNLDFYTTETCQIFSLLQKDLPQSCQLHVPVRGAKVETRPLKSRITPEFRTLNEILGTQEPATLVSGYQSPQSCISSLSSCPP